MAVITKALKTRAYYFIHEFLSSFMLFYAAFPIPVIIPDSTYVGWIYSFLSIVMIDILTMGAAVNPAINIALYINGNTSLDELILRVLGNFSCAFCVFKLMKWNISTKYYQQFNGPSIPDEMNAYSSGLAEVIFTFFLTFGILMTIAYAKSNSQKRMTIASLIRLLVIMGRHYTGPCMNPMIAIAWAYEKNLLSSRDYLITYCISPIIGSSFGALVFAIHEELKTFMIPPKSVLDDSNQKSKSD